ncbi:Asparagine synthetase domain-containing protein 1 [Rhynchospora pubera]|uniref:Asparagine synthetase domain-containing protein 1 n=1 Tax=Rhynchospora pubera TaxID=906938 RepID=A0AAV8GKS3_9POAL|nr:Asparagine synthetase domain-containing protein 1 [Rhynchospora pubera]
MCGIALILSDGEIQEGNPSLEELQSSLLRRGPDRLGLARVLLSTDGEVAVKTEVREKEKEEGCSLELCLIGAELQLRGVNTICQPLVSPSGNILIFNGEIFGGIKVPPEKNDAESLLRELESCCWGNEHKGKSVPDVLSSIRGPWALMYWQIRSRTVWYGRDAFGRRSLLVREPTSEDKRFIISSVAPPSSKNSFDGTSIAYTWQEIPCGIYSICLKEGTSTKEAVMDEKISKHEWRDPVLVDLINWERKHSGPDSILSATDVPQSSSAQKVLHVLRESVMRRTIVDTLIQQNGNKEEEGEAPIAILFSGGLDSMILAALLDQCLSKRYWIDLLNVSFDGESAPDRISAKSGLRELQQISPNRRWRLVEIDSSLSDLKCETDHVMSLIHPSRTYMDLNIGTALWLAAGGDGYVDGETCRLPHSRSRYKYRSKSRVLLIGSGADEQCAGYGRYRTKFRSGGWPSLEEEMRLDMQRIWKRNMGRDDRCVSDCGKEARFPFLDEDVIRSLLELPLWEIANLEAPAGMGDKKILRQVANLLGLHEAALLPKRAIQFGTRIARESNKKVFGSNRAANQASAGSVDIQLNAQ